MKCLCVCVYWGSISAPEFVPCNQHDLYVMLFDATLIRIVVIELELVICGSPFHDHQINGLLLLTIICYRNNLYWDR